MARHDLRSAARRNSALLDDAGERPNGLPRVGIYWAI
jgi:hypothetical protein